MDKIVPLFAQFLQFQLQFDVALKRIKLQTYDCAVINDRGIFVPKVIKKI